MFSRTRTDHGRPTHAPSEPGASSTLVMKNATLQQQISEFAAEISAALPRIVPADRLKPLINALPTILEAFAFKIGHDPSEEIQSRLMHVVHKYSTQIANAMINAFKFSFDDSEDPEFDADNTRPTDLVENPAFWNGQKHKHVLASTNTVSWDDGIDIGHPDFFPRLQEYRDVLLQSPAFSWLLNSVRREIDFGMPGEIHPCSQLGIRNAIVSALYPEPAVVVCGMPPPSYVLTFKLRLPVTFLAQEYDVPAPEVFDNVLVLAGTPGHTWATTCKQYVEKVWPDMGPVVLDIYRSLLRGEQFCLGNLFDGTSLWGERNGQTSQLQESGARIHHEIIAKGCPYSLAEVGEVIAFLSVALGSSERDGSLAQAYPNCKINGDKVFLWTGTLQARDINYTHPALSGFCVPLQDEPNTGMEAPLNIMAQLVGTSKISIFGGKFLIKGYSAVLVPTRKRRGFVYWHLVSGHGQDDDYVSYSDPRVMACLQQYPDDLSVSDLERSRHILGWSSHVDNCAGTRDANYQIDWSGLKRPRPGCAFEKVTIVGGMFITGGVSCILGKRDRPARLQGRSDYIMRLKWISKKLVILYDVVDRRAWIIDGATALLHLVRTSLHHDKNDGDPFKSLSVFDETLLQESPDARTGKSASIFVLTNQANLGLPLYAKPESTREETSTSKSGARLSVINTTRSNYTLQERIEGICDILEQIIAHQVDASTQDGVGFKVTKTLRRRLEGFDFMDVATDEDPMWPRFTNIRATGKGWVDFTRAVHAITLFGSGFGDLFRPTQLGTPPCNTCDLNIEVPKGRDHLAVCVSELQEILQRRGSKATAPYRLVDDIYWHSPDKTFEACQCKTTSPFSTKSDRVQVLVPSSFPKLFSRKLKSPAGLNEHPRGAVLFGHSHRFPLLWRDQGPLVEGSPGEEEMDELEESFHDSGLGTSQSSSSVEGVEGSGSTEGNPGDSPDAVRREPSPRRREGSLTPEEGENKKSARDLWRRAFGP
ncbi:hypothetical protein QBC34DRAFT_431355 [Podospora aff. communis PSN243]|uniref:Uncharacterized protein n=1 Tax=Podospora aff. communis PSN243 TaxID=3040156 RepID=A0AAV9G5S9_9PEZI|nr:hypothetical protein QBC34DRAFT_431355 [Podospora aff. communis PSN243]